jgi:mannan endo-1,4-beta-mannosidase
MAAAVLALALSAPAWSFRIYWGARIAGNVYGKGDAPFDWSAVTAFEETTGKQPSVIHFYAPFAHDCGRRRGCAFYPFNTTAFERVRRHGMIPMLTWSSASAPIRIRERAFQNADIVNGRYDRFIRRWARAAKSWSHPFFLRLNREMNGRWYPWSPGVNGNTAADFVAAWRHVHRIFTRVGATNATWVWCPNVDPNGSLTRFRKVYPGRRFVNWTCLDGYNFGDPWRSFGGVFRRSYRLIRRYISRRKPMMIGEVASTESGGSKAEWITDMLTTQLPRNFPKFEAVLWFNSFSDQDDWAIESSRAAKNAFASGIASRYYAPASKGFARLRFGRIHRLR